MEVSPPLRWLGALAIMFVVVLIVVPLLLQTVSDTVVLGGEPSEAAVSSAVAVAPSEAPTDDTGGEEEPEEEQAAEDDFPATYTVEAGDTGTKISEQFYDSRDGWSVIAEANDIDPSAPLRVGDELTIPEPE